MASNQLETIISGQDAEGEGHLASDLEEDPLPPKERQVLAYLANPDNEGVPLVKVAELFGIRPKTLARMRGRDRFVTEFQAAIMRRVHRHLPAVISALIESAKVEGKEGFQDRKLVLQLGGVLGAGIKDRSSGGPVNVNVQIGHKLERALEQAAQATAAPPPVVIDHTDPALDDVLPD